MTGAVVSSPEGLTTAMVVVFGVTVVALVLFVSGKIRIDVSALLVMVLLILLEPWTRVTPELGLSGFANPATLTVLAMFVLSEGVRRTGVIRAIGRELIQLTGDDETKQLAATIGLAGPLAGFVNNTPVVAILMPMVVDIAERTGTSPSRLLIPLSYAAMLGGMLTVIGTSPNILASDISARLLDRPFTMFEFTALGAIVLAAGAVYLLTAGRHLIPERIRPGESRIERYGLADYLGEVKVDEESALAGVPVKEIGEETGLDITVVRILRDGRELTGGLRHRRVRPGDSLLVRADSAALAEILEFDGVTAPSAGEDGEEEEAEEPPPAASLHGDETEEGEEDDPDPLHLVEVVVLPNTPLVGRSLRQLRFRQRYGGTVLGIHRRGRPVDRELSGVALQGGDALLIEADTETVERLATDRSLILGQDVERPDYRTSRVLPALGIVAAVVSLAALGVVPIVVAALAGMVAMVLTGCLEPSEVYEAVDWNVIFLLAGVIPLGIALERTGGASFLAEFLIPLADVVPVLVFAAVFYMVTAILTEILTNVASLVLMAPVAVDTAVRIGADPFSFLLLVTFAASCSLMTPVGYQTNLMVFDAGGYRFSDFLRVGVPLQVLLAAVTTVGIATIWGF
jgi:di/tricarboxylate transporter